LIGAAKRTIGTISAHDVSQDWSQFVKNTPSEGKRKLATADATPDVMPD
jgi:hypothetical protein